MLCPCPVPPCAAPAGLGTGTCWLWDAVVWAAAAWTAQSRLQPPLTWFLNGRMVPAGLMGQAGSNPSHSQMAAGRGCFSQPRTLARPCSVKVKSLLLPYKVPYLGKMGLFLWQPRRGWTLGTGVWGSGNFAPPALGHLSQPFPVSRGHIQPLLQPWNAPEPQLWVSGLQGSFTVCHCTEGTGRSWCCSQGPAFCSHEVGAGTPQTTWGSTHTIKPSGPKLCFYKTSVSSLPPQPLFFFPLAQM